MNETRRKLYLSRRDFHDRRLANEAELLPVLEAFDFEIVDLALTSFSELLGLLSSAEAVIGIDDEALAGLVVVPQGARVGVIATGGVFQPRAYMISGQLGHDFVYLGTQVLFDSNSVYALCDVALSVEVLRAFLAGVSV